MVVSRGWVPLELKNCWSLGTREDKPEEMGCAQRVGCPKIRFYRLPLFAMTVSGLQYWV